MAAPDEISPQPVTGRQETLSLRVRFQVLAVLSIFPAMIFPIWWAGLARERQYSDAGLALMQTMQMGGIFLASLALLVLEGRAHRGKLSALSLAMMGIAFLAVTFLPSLHEVLCAYLFMGIGMSAALSLSSIYIGQSSGPERQFAVQTGVGTLAGAINMAVFPYIQARFGAAGVQLSCALPVLVGALAVSTLPAGRALKEARKPGMLGLAQGSGRQPISWIASIPAIAATVAFSSFAYNLFNFSERTASARGIGLEAMGALLCVAMVCGLSGPAAGFLLGNRIGRAWPLGIAACVGTIGISLLLSKSTGQWGFGLGMTLYFFVYGLGQAFIYAQLMALDTSGRVLILSSPISAAGLVGTAALSVAISGRFGIDGVLWLSLAELIVCAPLIAFSELFNKAHAAKVSAT